MSFSSSQAVPAVSAAPVPVRHAGAASAAAGESIDAKLAKNLVAARVAAGVTQQELAHTAEISRATIAQLEAGASDPRLSTVVHLARALGVNPILLLLGTEEVAALGRMIEDKIAAGAFQDLQTAELREIRYLVNSGMLKNRAAAAKLCAAAAQAAGYPLPASIGAAIGATIEPGIGTVVGTLLAQLLSGDGSTGPTKPAADAG